MSKSNYKPLIVHTLPNPVFAPPHVRDVKCQIVAAKMEKDPWYQWNMGRFLLNVQCGKVAETVARNVAAHLNAMGNRRNAI